MWCCLQQLQDITFQNIFTFLPYNNVCVRACVCSCSYVQCVHMYVGAQMCVHMLHMWTYVHASVQICVCMCVSVRKCRFMCTCIYGYVLVFMHVYVCLCAFTHARMACVRTFGNLDLVAAFEFLLPTFVVVEGRDCIRIHVCSPSPFHL